MTHVRVKIAIGAVVLLLGLGLLTFAGISKSQIYYLEVDAFLADDAFHSQRVRLCGTVSEESLTAAPSAMTLRFDLLGRQGRVLVVYEGIVPEMFKAGADVVVEGRRDEAGTFRATQIMTKCASKYQPGDYPAGRKP